MLLLFLLSCTRSDAWVAHCAETDNPLRFACTASLGEPAALSWTVRDGGAVVRRVETSVATEHAVTLWGLPPDTTLTWEAQSAEGATGGTLTTGKLPDGVGDLLFLPTGEPEAVDHVLVPWDCSGEFGLALVGADGVIRWFEAFEGVAEPTDVGLFGFDWSDDDRIAVVRDRERVIEIDPAGEVAFDVSDLGLPLHHDIAYDADGRLHLLHAELVDDAYIVDGLYGLDRQGTVVSEWKLADHVEVDGPLRPGRSFWGRWFPGATDWSHGNGVSADGPDHLLVSLLAQHAVVRVAADHSHVDWVLTGASSDLPSDFTWTDGGGFVVLHAPVRWSTGQIGLFDNGLEGESSRAVLLDVDAEAGTVSEAESWWLPGRCPTQGGVDELPGGGALVTCNNHRRLFEFVPGEADPVWHLDAVCTTRTHESYLKMRHALPIRLQR